jgi:hypothetical protein
MEHLMLEAMNARLGLKSVWAKDINEATLGTLLRCVLVAWGAFFFAPL